MPIGGNVVRPYERPREGELAGTVGSRPPSFPIRREGEESSVVRGATGITGMLGSAGGRRSCRSSMTPSRPIDTAAICLSPRHFRQSDSGRAATSPAPAVLAGLGASSRRPVVQRGTGRAVVADRFVKWANTLDFPVYRLTNRRQDQIYIPSVAGGPVAPICEVTDDCRSR